MPLRPRPCLAREAEEGLRDASCSPPRRTPGIIEDYRRAALNAKKAGFDGVEIHGANGYLLDQFLQDSTNKRDDAYGGPVENRARLMLEVVDAAISVWGPERVGLHLAPRADDHSMGDSTREETFTYGRPRSRKAQDRVHMHNVRRKAMMPFAQDQGCFRRVFFANEAFTKAAAERVVAQGAADGVAFGKLFIANPDLPKRFALGAPLNAPQPDTFYGSGPAGYTDYPELGVAAE